MKLTKFVVDGYRRFRESNSMNLDGKLIAILGPNEAGKTSFLSAMKHLNDSTPFVQEGGSREIARGKQVAANHGVISATFLIEDSDLNLVANIEDTKKIRWLIVTKSVAGKFTASVSPSPQRSLTLRKKTVRSIKAAIKKLARNRNPEESSELQDYVESLNKLIPILEVDDEDVEESESLREAATLLNESTLAENNEYLKTLSSDLVKLADDEDNPPSSQAMQLLFANRPKFLLFDREARDLKPEYALNEVVANTPLALSNLSTLSGLKLSELFKSVSESDQGRVDTLTNKANAKLKTIFETSWSQTNVSVRLRVSGETLSILIDEEERDFHSIAERSDGLRQYVALLLFLSIEKTDQLPVLLIDEAETHLHYDAQADLVQMFARQDVASKVVYTTHSVGCLPEDFGTGIRLINPVDPNKSEITN